MKTLNAVAKALGLIVRGNSSIGITGLAPLAQAGSAHLSFVSNKRYLPALAETQAAAVILHPDWVDQCHLPCLISDQPYLSYAQATALFDTRPMPSGNIHPSAVIDASAILGDGVTVDAGAVISAGAHIGHGAWVGSNAVVGHNTRLGRESHLYPNVTLYHDVSVGAHCTVHANTVIGADGFGFAPNDGQWQKILQLGGVVIGDHVDIGASVTIDRGALTDTCIESHVIIDNQVHIAHNVHIKSGTAIAAGTAIAGSTVIGSNCTFGGMCGVADHIEIADNVHINGQGRVSKSLTEPGVYSSGTPIQPYRDWSRNAVRFEQLADMAKRLVSLEKQLALLSGVVGSQEEHPS